MESSMSTIEVKLRNWFKYSVIFTCAPFIFALLLWGIIGYPQTWLQIFPDLVLTVFSIGVNAVSYISDLEKQTNFPKRVVYVKDICEIILFFLLALYFGVFNFDLTKNILFGSEENANEAMHIMYVITWGFGIVYALSIAVIEIIVSRKEKKEEKVNNDSESKA